MRISITPRLIQLQLQFRKSAPLDVRSGGLQAEEAFRSIGGCVHGVLDLGGGSDTFLCGPSTRSASLYPNGKRDGKCRMAQGRPQSLSKKTVPRVPRVPAAHDLEVRSVACGLSC